MGLPPPSFPSIAVGRRAQKAMQQARWRGDRSEGSRRHTSTHQVALASSGADATLLESHKRRHDAYIRTGGPPCGGAPDCLSWLLRHFFRVIGILIECAAL